MKILQAMQDFHGDLTVDHQTRRDRIYVAPMPTTSRFRGISILMFINDHPPPHFHAEYGEYEAKIRIADGEMFEGEIPTPAYRLVRQWYLLHQAELNENWKRIERGELPHKIQPL